ncbi:MAG: nitronate monooxygenase [Saprospiraceae bacterium]|nr:nitronate monooxygenase [Saprospiraceae bacterium]
MNTRLTELLAIEHPILMAPMFLVSNVSMTIAAAKAGIAGCIPALNYRTDSEFRTALSELNNAQICYGINLIVNRSNYYFPAQLKACLEFKVPFIITSLGNPKTVIQAFQNTNTKVFCDVSNLEYARKAASFHPDGLIAVTNEAGGHLGPVSPNILVPELIKEFPNLIIISAGGVGDRKSLDEKLGLGADGVSVGSIFIASKESAVCQEYKQACVDFGAKDIVTTTKLSGIPCTVINTPYVQQIGTKQNWLQAILNKNKTLKKWFKMLTYKRGMDILSKAAFDATYQNVWCAGTTIEYVKDIKPVKEIVDQLLGNH